ncbi:MAG: hypothetical protein Q8K75_05340 [Chlamydiales bacterium]|nr:hypothetical protein [Chlamydiales bacterium]
MERYCHFGDTPNVTRDAIHKLEIYAETLVRNLAADEVPRTDVIAEIAEIRFAGLNHLDKERLNRVYQAIQTVSHIKVQWSPTLTVVLLAMSSADYFSYVPDNPLDIPLVPLASLTTRLYKMASLIFKLAPEQLNSEVVKEIRGKLRAQLFTFSGHWDIRNSEHTFVPAFQSRHHMCQPHSTIPSDAGTSIGHFQAFSRADDR